MKAESDSGFVFFHCWAEDFSDLPDETRLELFDAIVSYAKTGETKPLSRDAELVFRAIRRGIDAYAAKRERVIEARKKAGAKGGRASVETRQSKRIEANDSRVEANEANASFASSVEASSSNCFSSEANEALNIKEKVNIKVKGGGNACACACAHVREGGEETPLPPPPPPPPPPEKKSPSKRSVTADAIAHFLNAYPSKRNGMRNEMFDIWERDGLLERERELMDGLERWKASRDWRVEKVIPHAMRFLSESWWRIRPPDRGNTESEREGESEADELRRLGFRVS